MSPRRNALTVIAALGALAITFAASSAQTTGDRAGAGAASAIDAELDRRWREATITPAPLASDDVFLRRVSLDLIGRVPTLDETRAFIADARADRRERLVDSLLSSPDYADHWTDVYMDLLLGRDTRKRAVFASAPTAYFQQAFAANMPYDQLARELITATGGVDVDGVTGFVVARGRRGGNLPLLAGTTARVFLGVQIQCAECHDHPSIKTLEHEDFVRFTAFFGHLRNKHVAGQSSVIDRVVPMHLKEKPNFKARLKKQPQLLYGVTQPRFIGGGSAQRPGETRRQWLAREILATEMFSLAAANRLWARLLGQPIVAPVDDLGTVGGAHPALLTELAQTFRDSGYDHKHLLKTIVTTKAYQRASMGARLAGRLVASETQTETLEQSFAQYPVRTLSADQLFRSQLVATGLENGLNRRRRKVLVERARRRALSEFLVTFDDDEGDAADSFSGNVPQALLLRNGTLTNIGARAGKGLVLHDILAAHATPAARLDAMFLATYARRPDVTESKALLELLASRRNSRVAFQDLYHALLTSTEFITNH